MCYTEQMIIIYILKNNHSRIINLMKKGTQTEQTHHWHSNYEMESCLRELSTVYNNIIDL